MVVVTGEEKRERNPRIETSKKGGLERGRGEVGEAERKGYLIMEVGLIENMGGSFGVIYYPSREV